MSSTIKHPETFSSEDEYPFMRINRTFKVFTGIGMGILFGCLVNVLSKRPYLNRPHIHVTAATALGVINYKSYDLQESLHKKNFTVLAKYQDRLKRQEFVKSEIAKSEL
ncbi:hypothetical protein SAMD00019534_074170 [Acytostelium subglobosum LB1]|uniref:hypothetical protein n=1 Tax=Acytostelium subglobosum LB1 TaxID=1410327 RepID=UPI000644F6D4|nr:hypothetical protein SAMD00019534_074170 [Acytostelium subglobosum LB1]GAM24242.1 hypothetical protein SAMD00019534_074170 [Acytostelium subglobosum LB1]|eukprot:XP_012752568.1 hypothetical protein SAMD00019534_074170 [Acytostelium subglobosum LB1]